MLSDRCPYIGYINRKMIKPRILSGDEIVSRGITKLHGSLPEAGLKDVIPNGSWLEQKQVQSALEARKHLIEVERIEKRGVLSHANWLEDEMLAEVVQKAGGHWQYFGHNVGKRLFLQPEEALFLMEINCLQLKYNDVTVSLQQAYSLLLRSKVTILQYKVYSSLSRLGYKVFRYQEKKPIKTEKGDSTTASQKMKDRLVMEGSIDDKEREGGIKMEVEDNIEGDENSKEDNNVENISLTRGSEGNEDQARADIELNDTENTTPSANTPEESTNLVQTELESQVGNSHLMEVDDKIQNNESDSKIVCDTNISIDSEKMSIDSKSAELSEEITSQGLLAHSTHKLNNLKNRQMKPCDAKCIEKSFEKLDDLVQNQIVTITVPEEQYIPRNVFLNNLNYVLNLDSIRENTKSTRSEPTGSRPYSLSAEVNGDHVRRIRDSLNNVPVNNWPPPNSNPRFNNPNYQYRPSFWRPNFNLGIPLNSLFQSQRFIMFNMNMNFMHRFRPLLRPCPPVSPMPPRYPTFPMNSPNNNINNAPDSDRKRRNGQAKQNHLEAIKHLAVRLKQLVQTGNPQDQNVMSLTNLIRTFNTRYGTALRLTETFDIIQENVETITLDDENETASKKARQDNDKYTENINKLKQMALKLKYLESKKEATSRHRRAFSNLLKKFNRSYNADIYLNSNHEIIDRRFINLDSSSDSDCVAQEPPKTSSSRMLKNPFNIIKRLSEKQNTTTPDIDLSKDDNTNYKRLEKIFGKNWLPPEHDFGRAELLPRNIEYDCAFDSQRDQFLFEYLRNQPHDFPNWLEIKIAFLKSYEETRSMMAKQSQNAERMTEIKSIIGPEDCTDAASILKKLSIIKCNKEINTESVLAVDFDVYNRDVQNFRKSNRPEPHFRVICMSESSSFPAGKEVAYLHSKYPDTPIAFAIVGVGSISYLQINPFDLPVYIPSNDLT